MGAWVKLVGKERRRLERVLAGARPVVARAAGDVGDTSHNRQARLAGRQEHGKAVETARRLLADLRRE